MSQEMTSRLLSAQKFSYSKSSEKLLSNGVYGPFLMVLISEGISWYTPEVRMYQDRLLCFLSQSKDAHHTLFSIP